MSLSIIALFAMQASWSYTFKMIYMWVTYLLVTIFSTCCNMPFGALNGVLTSDSGECAKLSGLRMVFSNVGASWAGLIEVPLIVFFSGVGGALFAMYVANAQAKVFTSTMTYEILLIVVIGLPIRSRKWSSRRSIRSRSR